MQVAAAAFLAGFRGDDLVKAVAVARGESNFNTEAGPNPSCNCRGLWQINLDAHTQYKAPEILHPVKNAEAAHKIWGGDWCGKRASNGHCGKFEAYGLDNAGATWAAKLEQGKRAEKNFWANVHSRQIKSRISVSGQVFGPKSNGECAREILKEAGFPDAGGGDPSLPEAIGNVPGVGAALSFFSFPNLEGFAKALTSGNTWLRVGQVAVGVVLIVVGLVKVSGGAANLIPVGRVAKALT